eukprot:1960091-Pyramimonas_sp.AAC.1
MKEVAHLVSKPSAREAALLDASAYKELNGLVDDALVLFKAAAVSTVTPDAYAARRVAPTGPTWM